MLQFLHDLEKNIVTRVALDTHLHIIYSCLTSIYSAEQYLIENYNLDRMPQNLEHK